MSISSRSTPLFSATRRRGQRDPQSEFRMRTGSQRLSSVCIKAMSAKIYTRTGDTGDTGLFGGQRVGKDDDRVEAYGTVDELNAILGVTRTHGPDPELGALLAKFQSGLFYLGADLA